MIKTVNFNYGIDNFTSNRPKIKMCFLFWFRLMMKSVRFHLKKDIIMFFLYIKL